MQHLDNKDKKRWELDAPCSGPVPSPRFGHSAVALGSQIYIFGGQGFSNSTTVRGDDKLTSFRDMHCLDTEQMVWSNVEYDTSIGKSPPSLNSHSSALGKDGNFNVFGGSNSVDGPNNKLWIFHPQTKTWEPCKDRRNNLPSAREMHAACVDTATNFMYVMGGRGTQDDCLTVFQDLWRLDLGS